MSGKGGERMGEPIENYLDELLLRLRVSPRETRRILIEAESHLRDAADVAEQRGLSREDAEREAVRRFGSADEVARAAWTARRLSPLVVAGQLAWAGLAVGGAVLLAIGVSGALAGLANATLGPRFVGALPETYPIATCHYYLAAHHTATTCAQAAMLENSQDAVTLRLLAGAIGVLVVTAAFFVRRRLPGSRVTTSLRDGVLSGVAAIGFTVGTGALVAVALDLAVQHGSGGVGFYLSGALASAGAAGVAARLSYTRLQGVRPWTFGAPVSAA